MTETRKDQRAPMSLKVRFKSATVDEFIEQYSRDVSRGGVFIKSKQPMSVGTLLKFELQLKDEKRLISGVGRVVWRREPHEVVADEEPAGMGIKFIKMDPESRSLVEQIVRGRSDSELSLSQPPASRTETPRHKATIQFFPSSGSLPPPGELPSEDRTQVRHADEFLATALAEAGADSAKSLADQRAEEAHKKSVSLASARSPFSSAPAGPSSLGSASFGRASEGALGPATASNRPSSASAARSSSEMKEYDAQFDRDIDDAFEGLLSGGLLGEGRLSEGPRGEGRPSQLPTAESSRPGGARSFAETAADDDDDDATKVFEQLGLPEHLRPDPLSPNAMRSVKPNANLVTEDLAISDLGLPLPKLDEDFASASPDSSITTLFQGRNREESLSAELEDDNDDTINSSLANSGLATSELNIPDLLDLQTLSDATLKSNDAINTLPLGSLSQNAATRSVAGAGSPALVSPSKIPTTGAFGADKGNLPKLAPPNILLPNILDQANPPPKESSGSGGKIALILILLILLAGGAFFVWQNFLQKPVAVEPPPVAASPVVEPPPQVAAPIAEETPTAPAEAPPTEEGATPEEASAEIAVVAPTPSPAIIAVPYRVESTPSGAEVWTTGPNATRLGTAPFAVPENTGPVELRSLGYLAAAVEVPLRANAVVRKTLVALPCVVDVTSTPPGARIQLAGQSAVTPARITVPRCSAPWRMTVILRGYERSDVDIAPSAFVSEADAQVAHMAVELRESRAAAPSAPRAPAVTNNAVSVPSTPTVNGQQLVPLPPAEAPTPTEAPAPREERPAPTPEATE